MTQCDATIQARSSEISIISPLSRVSGISPVYEIMADSKNVDCYNGAHFMHKRRIIACTHDDWFVSM